MPVAMPDLASFSLHEIVYDVDIEGVSVPGLCAVFYRCADGDRILSVGIYMLGCLELFRVWGHADREHWAYHSVMCADGSQDGPHVGCPDVEALTEDGEVCGVAITTRDHEYFIPVAGATG